MTSAEILVIGKVLAESSWERGQRPTDEERHALVHEERWGSDGWPIARRGRLWWIDSPLARGAGGYRTKTEAGEAWQILIAKVGAMLAMERRSGA